MAQHAGRPTAISPEVAAKIKEFRTDPSISPAMLHRMLQSAGIPVARRTLYRHLQREGLEAAERPEALMALPPPVPAEALADGSRFTPEALLADVRKRYLEACGIADALKARAALGSTETRRWFEATRIAADLAAYLTEMAPPPVPDPENDPANVAAKERLLARARELAKASPKA